MMMAGDGLPKGGSIGYEIFDQKEGFGTTSFVQNINYLRAMEGELSRTIGTMNPIQTARVHLVLPQRELFSHNHTNRDGQHFHQNTQWYGSVTRTNRGHPASYLCRGAATATELHLYR